MKISRKEAFFLLGLVGILAVLVVYLTVFQPYSEKTEALQAESAQLKTQVQELEVYAAQVEEFEAETKRMVEEINTIFERFPSESRAEDAIMYAVDLENQDEETFISSIGLSSAAVAYETAPYTLSLKDGSNDGEEHIYRLNVEQVTYANEFTYDGMKRYINTIVEDVECKSIETINLAFNSETGILTGNTVMNLYTIEGTDKGYESTYIPPMRTGKPNIFGTIDNPTGVVETEGETEGEETEE